jgi:hypothetical protein
MAGRKGPYVPCYKGAWPRPLPRTMPLFIRGAYRPQQANTNMMWIRLLPRHTSRCSSQVEQPPHHQEQSK